MAPVQGCTTTATLGTRKANVCEAGCHPPAASGCGWARKISLSGTRRASQVQVVLAVALGVMLLMDWGVSDAMPEQVSELCHQNCFIDTKRPGLSPHCHLVHVPKATSFHPGQYRSICQTLVDYDQCQERVPADVTDISLSCATDRSGTPALNISWVVPEGSRGLITAYWIMLQTQSLKSPQTSSFLAKAYPDKPWFLLHQYNGLDKWKNCPTSDYACANEIRIVSLPSVYLAFWPKNNDKDIFVGARIGGEDPVTYEYNKAVDHSLWSCLGNTSSIPFGSSECHVVNVSALTNGTRDTWVEVSNETASLGNTSMPPDPTVRPDSPDFTSTLTKPVQTQTTATPTSFSFPPTDGNTPRILNGTSPTVAVDVSHYTNQTVILAVVLALGLILLLPTIVVIVQWRRFPRHTLLGPAGEDLSKASIEDSKHSHSSSRSRSTSSSYGGGHTPPRTPLPEYRPPLPTTTDVPPPPITPPLITSARSHVYISYSRADPQHRQSVRWLADWLHENGIAVVADFYYTNEVANGPQFFVEKGITASRFVLVVCSEPYMHVWTSDQAEDSVDWAVLQPPSMLTQWEINLLRICMSDMAGSSPEIIPVMVLKDDADELPRVPDVVPLAMLNRRVYGLGTVATNKDQLHLLQRLHGNGA